ncbi:WecB/TagA/CpsF family glycosyltransferase [Photobacterium leiognathi]|uniref:WecB/TagA/CpsF family glycosyltransferase n=1 Tax=Photobacterium leiognathi TaxID=553611 RepID=UPI0029816D88|nr:WecB/TagA/CpsF family glycosyltransferase [Photobacterium leiognathi]
MLKTKISTIPVDCFINMGEAVDYILREGKGKIAVAINPEKILAALKEESVKDALLRADIRYLDGIGTVKVAERKLNQKLMRIPGCELWESLMKESRKQNKSVFLLGANSDVVGQTQRKLELQYNTNIIGINDGFFNDDNKMIQRLLALQPDILTVAMGSPRQELFMQKCKKAGLNSFMMGVGGTYNVYVGSVKRAPEFWRNLNLEWLYRLICEPSRLLRQLKLSKFILLALSEKI